MTSSLVGAWTAPKSPMAAQPALISSIIGYSLASIILHLLFHEAHDPILADSFQYRPYSTELMAEYGSLTCRVFLWYNARVVFIRVTCVRYERWIRRLKCQNYKQTICLTPQVLG